MFGGQDERGNDKHRTHPSLSVTWRKCETDTFNIDTRLVEGMTASSYAIRARSPVLFCAVIEQASDCVTFVATCDIFLTIGELKFLCILIKSYFFWRIYRVVENWHISKSKVKKKKGFSNFTVKTKGVSLYRVSSKTTGNLT